MELFFQVPGRPISWKRVNRYMGRGIEPKEQRIKKQEISSYALAAMASGLFRKTRSPVSVHCWFYGPHPLSDIDNLTKLILDALNEVAWDDDRQVVEIWSEKIGPCEIKRTDVLIKIKEGLENKPNLV